MKLLEKLDLDRISSYRSIRTYTRLGLNEIGQVLTSLGYFKAAAILSYSSILRGPLKKDLIWEIDSLLLYLLEKQVRNQSGELFCFSINDENMMLRTWYYGCLKYNKIA